MHPHGAAVNLWPFAIPVAFLVAAKRHGCWAGQACGAGRPAGSARFREARPGARRRFVARAQRVGIVFLACTGVWLLTGGGAFWPGWVLLIGLIGLAVRAQRVFTTFPADEDELV